MNKDKMREIIINQSKSDFNIDMSELTKKYPYCNTFNLIYITSEAKKKLFGFDDFLTKNAHKIIDREILKNYVIKNNEEIKDNEIDKNNNDLKSSTKIKKDNSTEKIQNLEENPLNIEITNQAINSSIQLEVKKISEEPNVCNEIKPEENKSNTLTKEKSFFDWLNPINNIVKEDEEKKKKEELLTKFIRNKPNISKPKKEFYSPIKSAQKSIEENNEMITETLAKIYELQNRNDKAIECYEKLSLVYPKKSTYFARIIKKIKEKQ